jgi:hypothetical protein
MPGLPVFFGGSNNRIALVKSLRTIAGFFVNQDGVMKCINVA